ncbi:2,3-diketo-5-methylthiopentyl-1-phosphate enolase [Paenibacillus shirakamiensis]|uniref:2,3-diketo-5-methylthiopentyl-1-phosphate enolase n=1 Tax=Paenibacillus shirakamiensis TaxID=1265935 RepID=A0ABS4JCZ9_9BACL|nr:2,3-diketo-5-methylthiopentyl-1-phosphate enolase [Paenibacillus shirakamiensis]MBP1999595.1 2,3-diketo-5-methylthiopentyl-1-phosphate enolase [Paenibacillus shirakamiensis]
MSYCTATYRIHDAKADFQRKAESIAVGMTVGSWTELPQLQQESMRKHLGHVVSVKEAESAAGKRYADVTIAYPDLNFSRDLPALLITAFGKISMDGQIKLLDLDFSENFLSHMPGPKFGIEGIRSLLHAPKRPLLMSIFKSVVGYDLEGLKQQFLAQALGGVDLIKDDEILFDNPLTPIERRAEICRQAAEEAEQTTGKKLLYAVNLTGRTSELRKEALKAIDAGASALLFSPLAYGLDVLQELSSDSDIHVPIAAHPSLAGALYPAPNYGIAASLLLGKLMRSAGADLVLFPSPYGSVVMPREENLAIRDELVRKDSPLRTSFPVPSAGIHPGLTPRILADFGQDVVVNAGGGIHGHPGGAAAGGRAFQQAIEASLAGQSLEEAAEHHAELKAALQLWGGQR